MSLDAVEAPSPSFSVAECLAHTVWALLVPDRCGFTWCSKPAGHGVPASPGRSSFLLGLRRPLHLIHDVPLILEILINDRETRKVQSVALVQMKTQKFRCLIQTV